MSSPLAVSTSTEVQPPREAATSPDVQWLIDRDHTRRKVKPPTERDIPLSNSESQPQQPPTAVQPAQGPPTPQVEKSAFIPTTAEVSNGQPTNAVASATSNASPASAATSSPDPAKSPARRPSFTGRRTADSTSTKSPPEDHKNKPQGKRGWISNLSSKFSSSPTPSPRNATTEGQPKPATPAATSPKVEFANPFNKVEPKKDTKENKKEEKVVVVPHAPRRQSVLVHAGQERKESNPGFLQNALRRLSSSNATNLGKAANTGAVCPRRIMNVDQNRDRVKIADLDQKNLRRVAFCVDVEIAGYAQHIDEENGAASAAAKLPVSQQQSQATAPEQDKQKRDTKDAKYKEKGEGAALKNPTVATEEKEETGTTKVDAAQAAEADEAAEASKEAEKEGDATKTDTTTSEPSTAPTTRKKEKKKRSEAERKERREKKRKRAEANGEVPLELSARYADDSDSSPGSNGSNTPSRASDQPTTDPLRIYKRCCQLRETSALKKVMEQIAKPSSTLSEIQGTVAVLDLSGSQIPLQDIVTLGDWLAVVPVRKLMLDDCGLTDEAIRVVLSGLSACKSIDQARQNKRLPKRGTGKRGQEHLGVIEKLSLKNNQFTSLGWKHVALFLHMSRSIKAIDLSGNSLPNLRGDLSRTSTASSNSLTGSTTSKSPDIAALLHKALTQRLGDRLEEMILSSCSLTANDIAKIVESAIQCKIKRLGLADNNITLEGLEHITRYLQAEICEGLDLGSNELHGQLSLLCQACDNRSPLFALSLADCNLTPSDLGELLPALTRLGNLRFIDLSHNHALFSSDSNAVAVLRRQLPKLRDLRRIHLADVDMASDHLIALAEVLPECPALAHITILENPDLVRTMNTQDETSQEEACAMFASLMAAARVSRTIIAIEVEVPSAESSEVVRALASQVVAYTLRNMERSALNEYGVSGTNHLPDKDAPEVLLHLVGHMEGYSENHDNDEPAPDEDYLIASTGIVKALGVCLRTADGTSRAVSRNISPTASGAATPRHGVGGGGGSAAMLRPDHFQKKPRNVSLELCESARKIRMRLRPALVREDQAGNDVNYRRLQFLDSTLERIIQRFEEEYPETKVEPVPSPPDRRNQFDFRDPPGTHSLNSSLDNASPPLADANGLTRVMSSEEVFVGDGDEGHPDEVHVHRTTSSASLAARAQSKEEGEMHRFGQKFRREIMKPVGTLDYAHGTTTDDEPEPEHVARLRARLEQFSGDELRAKVDADGIDNVIKELGISMKELRMLEREDPVGFELFKDSQAAAQLNAQQTASATTT